MDNGFVDSVTVAPATTCNALLVKPLLKIQQVYLTILKPAAASLSSPSIFSLSYITSNKGQFQITISLIM
jgi:hypothetical protein